MEFRRNKALFITLIVWIPAVALLCTAVVVWVVLPNIQGVQPVAVPETRISVSSDNRTRTPEQVVKSSGVLFVLGIVFASGLFVFLVVIITIVCVWACQARGYSLRQDPHYEGSAEVAGNHDIQLKEQTNSSSGRWIEVTDSQKQNLNNSSLLNLSSLPLNTVSVANQVNSGKTSGDQSRELEDKQSDTLGEFKSVHPQNYGTLNRTRLLSSVDEDGYHIDNLGFDFEENNSEFLPPLSSPDANLFDENTRVLVENLEKELKEPSDNLEVLPNSPQTDLDLGSQESPVHRQLKKEDSFHGLPPLKSFDNYLTLVRLDSTTSLSSVSLEEARKQWKSIEEKEENDSTENSD